MQAALTQNGAVTNEDSGSNLLNMFFSIASYRHKESEVAVGDFWKAWAENQTLALRLLFYLRDVRGGQGQRQVFRDILKDLASRIDLSEKFIRWIAEYGRWDDTFELLDTMNESKLKTILAIELTLENKLLAKWMPREKSAKKELAKKLRKLLGLSSKDYRKLIAGNTEVVETLMCSNQWQEIVYSHVPSQAGLRYKRAFAKRDGERYQDYVQSVLDGNVAIKATTLFPHQLVTKCFEGKYDKTVQALWENLPDYLAGTGESLLPVVDVSGSMEGTPMIVAIALGIYLAERNEGHFKNKFLTFSESPQWASVPKGSLDLKVQKVRQADWGYNTDLEKTFRLIKNLAIRNQDVPDKVIILSDMEFDEACEFRQSSTQTFFESMKDLFAQENLQMPSIIFWNLSSRSNYPVRVSEWGTVMVSGFSPSIMKHILKGGGEITPFQFMLQTLGSDRYAQIYL